jgi:hypothetical protein
VKDAAMQMIVDHHRVQKTEAASERKNCGISATWQPVHARKRQPVRTDDSDLTPLRLMPHEPWFAIG